MRVPKPAALFLVLLGTGSVAAQSTPLQSAPSTSTPVQTETASIYITAATKKGMLIRDLKPEDLTITENRVSAKIDKLTCGKGEPLLVGILMDTSGSRRLDPHLRSHYDALVAFLNQLLTGDDRAYLMTFDVDVHELSGLMSDQAEISTAFEKLRKYEPRGSTALYDGIKEAAGAKFKGRSGRRILVVIGDWEDNSSQIRLEDAVKDAQKSSTTVYAIMDDAGAYKALKKGHKQAVYCATRIADETGGLVYEVYAKEDFARVLEAIREAVTGSCRVEYTILRNGRAKKGVGLHVEANSKDVSILYPRVRFGSSQ